MITLLKGELHSLSAEPPRAVMLTSCGIGYAVSLPVFAYQQMMHEGTQEGDQVELHIYYSVTERQPLPLLVGFRDIAQRAFFEQFLQVEGIGPTKAVNALILPVDQIARAIETEDTATLASMPGIGARAAQKIIATLKGKVADAVMTAPSSDDQPRAAAPSDTKADVVNVLIGLGYRGREAAQLADEALRRNPEHTDDLQRILQEIFRASNATSGINNR